MLDQLPDEYLPAAYAANVAIEMNDEQMRDAEFANERDLVLRRGQQMRRILRTQHFRRMRIERDDHRRSARFLACAAEVEMTAW